MFDIAALPAAQSAQWTSIDQRPLKIILVITNNYSRFKDSCLQVRVGYNRSHTLLCVRICVKAWMLVNYLSAVDYSLFSPTISPRSNYNQTKTLINSPLHNLTYCLTSNFAQIHKLQERKKKKWYIQRCKHSDDGFTKKTVTIETVLTFPRPNRHLCHSFSRNNNFFVCLF